MRSRIAFAVLLLTGLPLLSADEEKYQFKIVDIVYRVENIGGVVQDLAVRESDVDIRIDLNADVLFEFDQATLLPKAEEVLQRAAAFLKEKGRGTVRIEGHTDSKGDDAYNLRLSLKRADAVKRWMSEKGGVAAAQMTSKGLGEKNPIAPNTKPDGSDDPEGRQKNRRVEIVITK